MAREPRRRSSVSLVTGETQMIHRMEQHDSPAPMAVARRLPRVPARTRPVAAQDGEAASRRLGRTPRVPGSASAPLPKRRGDEPTTAFAPASGTAPAREQPGRPPARRRVACGWAAGRPRGRARPSYRGSRASMRTITWVTVKNGREFKRLPSNTVIFSIFYEIPDNAKPVRGCPRGPRGSLSGGRNVCVLLVPAVTRAGKMALSGEMLLSRFKTRR